MTTTTACPSPKLQHLMCQEKGEEEGEGEGEGEGGGREGEETINPFFFLGVCVLGQLCLPPIDLYPTNIAYSVKFSDGLL